MPRISRIKSNSGIYHIIMRGINRQTLFEDEEDYTKFIHTMLRYKELCEYKLFAYCLMGNHLHMLLMEGKEPLGIVMKRICGSYVFWYNKKYDRIGYLFQDRFKSEPVEDETYFLTALRYIFQNPIKAGIVNSIRGYPWSNFNDYIEGNNETETEFALNLFSTDKDKAVKCFIEYMNIENDDECMDITEKRQITDTEASKIIKRHCKIDSGIDLQKLDINKRNSHIKALKEGYGLSIRQIERLTGVSRGIIQRI